MGTRHSTMKPSLVLVALVLLLSTSIAQQDQHAHECAADLPRANGDAFLDADGDGFPDALPVLDPSTSCYARGQWISGTIPVFISGDKDTTSPYVLPFDGIIDWGKF